MKSNIISLKIEANEAIRIKEEFEKQLDKKNNDCERLEEEFVSLRKKVEGMDKISKSSQALDDMLSHQRSPFDKSGLGYKGESSSKDDHTSNNKNMRKSDRNNDAPSSSKGKEKSQGNNGRNPAPRKLADNVKNTKGNEYFQGILRQKDLRSTTRKSPSSRYQSLFLVYYYSCTNFGHMAKDCRAYHKDKYNGPRQSPRSNFARRSHEFLFKNNIECFKCHNIGHTHVIVT